MRRVGEGWFTLEGIFYPPNCVSNITVCDIRRKDMNQTGRYDTKYWYSKYTGILFITTSNLKWNLLHSMTAKLNSIT